MKRVIYLSFFLIIININAQEKTIITDNKYKKHELRVDISKPLIGSVLDISYEYILSKNSSIGAKFIYLYAVDDKNDFFIKKALNLYYRKYFFNKNIFTKGFFLEGFTSLNDTRPAFKESAINLGFGLSVGNKFIIKSKFIIEPFIAFGLNVFKNKNYNTIDDNILGNFGLSIGYRF